MQEAIWCRKKNYVHNHSRITYLKDIIFISEQQCCIHINDDGENERMIPLKEGVLKKLMNVLDVRLRCGYIHGDV